MQQEKCKNANMFLFFKGVNLQNKRQHVKTCNNNKITGGKNVQKRKEGEKGKQV